MAKADMITDKVNPATTEKHHIADRFPLSWTLKESKIQQKRITAEFTYKNNCSIVEAKRL